MSSSSGSTGNSLLRIAMPVASSLILAYYVFTLPMSFMGGGGSGDVRSEITGNLQVPVQTKVEVSVAPPVSIALAAPRQAKETPKSSKGPALEDKASKDREEAVPKLKSSAPKKTAGTNSPPPTEPRLKDPELPLKKPAASQDLDEKDAASSTDPVPIPDDMETKVDARRTEAKKENVEDLSTQELATQEDLTGEELGVDIDEETGVGTGVFHSFAIFKKNYQQMLKRFKIFIYPDGDPNTYYQTPRKITGKYASEGYFFQNLRESKFVTKNPNKAHLFFIPISCHKMRGKGISYEKMADIVQEYVEGLIVKYPYWNRTLGADHFFVTCHDVGARATNKVANLVKNSIRVVCSPSYNGDFIPHKDIAMPQVLQPFALPRGGNDVRNRTILGFWAGHRNSKIRVVLAKLWEEDDVLAISNNRISRATGELVYQKQFYRSKFCICPGGSQVNSARIVDSIHYGCVPVILSDHYDLPFNDVLDWKRFALLLRERDVGDLKLKLQSV
ncbi:probable glycosyltransferase At5g20260, partial [Selaginella moellendorffii]|uniref:probable glycosyltransferase At5g20260 n=1 Tax=Selaginella moellendorffii TaxID=88036 RepID=UPI000D1C4BA8